MLLLIPIGYLSDFSLKAGDLVHWLFLSSAGNAFPIPGFHPDFIQASASLASLCALSGPNMCSLIYLCYYLPPATEWKLHKGRTFPNLFIPTAQ